MKKGPRVSGSRGDAEQRSTVTMGRELLPTPEAGLSRTISEGIPLRIRPRRNPAPSPAPVEPTLLSSETVSCSCLPSDDPGTFARATTAAGRRVRQRRAGGQFALRGCHVLARTHRGSNLAPVARISAERRGSYDG